VLERAAAAHAEMRADRSDVLSTRLKDLDQTRMVTLWIDSDLDPLSGQSERHEDRT
jgi:hypothetical protein